VELQVRYPWYVPYLTAFLICVVYFLFQVLFMQQFLDWDQIVYANNIKRALLPGRKLYENLYNPHHLHMTLSGKFFHEWVVSHFGEAGLTDVVFNNRIRSLLAACAGMYAIIILVRNITKSLVWGVVAGILLGSIHSYMSYATQIDTPIFPAAAFILTVWVVHRLETTRRLPIAYGAAGAVILFLGVMGHQFMGIISVLACVSVFLPPFLFRLNLPGRPFRVKSAFAANKPVIDKNMVKRYQAGVVMSILGAALIIGAFFWAGKTQYNMPFGKGNPVTARGPLNGWSFQQWLFLYANLDTWGHGINRFDPRAPLRGYTDAFLSQIEDVTRFNRNYRFLYNVKTPFAEISFSHNQLAYFTAGVFLGLILLFPVMWKKYKRTFFFLLSSLISCALFTTYWEPQYYEFWLVPAISVLILGILIAQTLGSAVNILLEKVGLWGSGGTSPGQEKNERQENNANRIHGRRIGEIPFIFYFIFLAFVFFAHNNLYYLIDYSRGKKLEGYSRDWEESYYMDLYSDQLYLFPDNVHKKAFGTEKGEVK